MAEFKFRASGIGTFYECQYKAKLDYELSKNIEGPALRIGTNVHSTLIHKMSQGIIPYPSDISKEEEDEISFLHVPAKFPVMDLSRGSYFITENSLFEKAGCRISTVVDGDHPFIFTVPSVSSLSEAADILKTNYDRNCPVEFKLHELKRGKGKAAYMDAGLNIMSKTRGSSSSVSSIEILGEEHRETSVYEVVDRDMFSRPLVSFEQRTTHTIKIEVMGEVHVVTISGQYDAAGPGIIMDIKTAASKPNASEPGTFMKYVIQQGVYAYLNGIKDVKVVLFYIVKTKVPQVVPIVFNFKTSNLKAIEELIKQYIKVVHYYDRGALFRSFGTGCKWCHVKETCLSDFALYPNMLDIMEIQHNDFQL